MKATIAVSMVLSLLASSLAYAGAPQGAPQGDDSQGLNWDAPVTGGGDTKPTEMSEECQQCYAALLICPKRCEVQAAGICEMTVIAGQLCDEDKENQSCLKDCKPEFEECTRTKCSGTQ